MATTILAHGITVLAVLAGFYAQAAGAEDSVLVAVRPPALSEPSDQDAELPNLSGLAEATDSEAAEATDFPFASDQQGAPTPAVAKPNPDAAKKGLKRTPPVAPAPAPGDLASTYKAATDEESPAVFMGVRPGVSTSADLESNWGEADRVSTSPGGEVRHFSIEPFAGVAALVNDDVVQLIKVELASQESPEKLARRLRLDAFEPVRVEDDATGETLGISYPEKGLMLLLAPGARVGDPSRPEFVTHLAIQTEDPQAYALRAEKRPNSAYSKRLADLQRAVELDPQSAYSWWMLSDQQLRVGQIEVALKAAEKALEIEPASDAYRLRRCECLRQLGRFDESVLETRRVLDSTGAPQLVRAQSLLLMGRLASLGESGIAQKAIGFYEQAIQTGDPLTLSEDPRERLAAQQLLLEAHLATAEEIARRKYANKQAVIGQWIGRASALAEKMIESREAGLEVRLQVATVALAASSAIRPAIDPAPLVNEAEETATLLLADSSDPLFRAAVEWELGVAYFRAMQTEHSRQQPQSALKFAELAMERLGAGGESRAGSAAAANLIAELYFHQGALQAVHMKNHKEAVGWYDKARPMLDSNQPKSELFVPRRYGESLVSMGVSYWEVGQKETAIELTLQGATLMNAAVTAGVLERSALGVPYSNLATMYRKQGDAESAARYDKLTREADQETATVVPAPKAGSSAATKAPSAAKPTTLAKAQPGNRSMAPSGVQSASATRNAPQRVSRRVSGRGAEPMMR